MQLKLKNIVTTSIFALASVGSAIASVQLFIPQQPAFAGDSLGECIQDLRDYGVSAREAANICRNQRDRNRDDDRRDRDDRDDRDDWDNNRDRRGRNRYIELRARSGRTSEGRWRYSASGVPHDAMRRAGCQYISGDDWRCATPKIRVLIRDQQGQYRNRNQRVQYIELRARSGRTSEGRWRYSASGVPHDAMQRAGCQHISGDDWRCATPRIRVQITNRY